MNKFMHRDLELAKQSKVCSVPFKNSEAKLKIILQFHLSIQDRADKNPIFPQSILKLFGRRFFLKKKYLWKKMEKWIFKEKSLNECLPALLGLVVLLWTVMLSWVKPN